MPKKNKGRKAERRKKERTEKPKMKYMSSESESIHQTASRLRSAMQLSVQN
jgi:IMP dehydrogenase/GMP reductase